MKARLEAVIYAAEEPVTLAQLAALFAEEAFAWKAEREAASAAGAAEIGDGDAPAAVELAESGRALGAELSELLLTPGENADFQGEQTGTSPADNAVGSAVETPREETSAAETGSGPAENVELEAKRAERRREREVREILRQALNELITEYAQDGRGIEIREIAGGFRMGTKPEMHDSVRAFVKSLKPPLKLSLPALETLAVIAYKQPVTAPEVSEIRGVDSAGVLGSLMSRKLIATAGRKQVIGRPMLYKTTKEFLVRFGLKDVSELPSMEEFEKMAAMELSEEAAEEESTELAAPVEQSGELFVENSETPETGAESEEKEAHRESPETASQPPTCEEHEAAPEPEQPGSESPQTATSIAEGAATMPDSPAATDETVERQTEKEVEVEP